MTVFFIGAGPGDPELITVRGLRLIERCEVCLYAGSLVPEAVVAAAPEDARVIDTASLTLDDIIDEIGSAHADGKDVARVHSGDPSLYGAIAEQIRRLKALGIDYQIVPGVSAYAAAAAGPVAKRAGLSLGRRLVLVADPQHATPGLGGAPAPDTDAPRAAGLKRQAHLPAVC